MGFFGKKKKAVAAVSEYQNMGPGAYAIATPVPDRDEENQQMPTAKVVGKASAPPTITATLKEEFPTLAGSGSEGYNLNDPSLTRQPMLMKQCPNCKQESRTRVETFPTWQNLALAVVLFFVFWPVCWMPLVLDSCKRTNHHCIHCGAHVGRVDAFQDCCVEKMG